MIINFCLNIFFVALNLPTGNGGEGHTGQQRPGGVIGLLHVGRTQDTTAQSMRIKYSNNVTSSKLHVSIIANFQDKMDNTLQVLGA